MERTGLNPLGGGLMYRGPGPSPARVCKLCGQAGCMHVKGFTYTNVSRKAENRAAEEEGLGEPGGVEKTEARHQCDGSGRCGVETYRALQ